MRLKSIDIEAFRAFARAHHFNLDADIILLYGRNGFGKTSVFDAISWCLFGFSKRLSGTRDFTRADASFITNAFREAGEERVRLVLARPGPDIEVERRGSRFSLFDGETALDGGPAERRLLQLMGFEHDSSESLRTLQRQALDSFSRSFLLQQAFLSQFMTSNTPRQRFDAFSELFSLTPVRDFYTHLSTTEHSRASELVEGASRRLDIASAELTQLEGRLSAERNRVERIVSEGGRPSAHPSADYSVRLKHLVDDVRQILPDITAEDTKPLDTIDRAILRLSEFATRLERELSALHSLRERVPLLSKWEVEQQNLAASIAAAESLVQEKQAQSMAAQAEVQQLLESLRALEDKINVAAEASQQLNSFVSDAIEFVAADECPVCLRPIERQTLLRQLRERLEAADPAAQEMTARRSSIRGRVRAAEHSLEQARAELREAEERRQALVAESSQLDRSVQSVRESFRVQVGVEVPVADSERAIRERLEHTESESVRADDLRAALQDLRPSFELIETRRRISELEGGCGRQGQLVSALRESLEDYRRVDKTLEVLVSASRRAERSVVEEFVERFREPIRNAYRWLSPHPLFTELDFEFGERGEAGELYFQVSRGPTHLNPSTAFSAAQANALALAVFLSLNAAQEWCPLDSALIDDPLQNMDDVNVLSFVDMVKTLVGERQLLLSTCVPHLHRLLVDKLRPRAEGERLISHRFEALTEDGPTIEEDLIDYVPSRRALPELLRLSA